MTKKDFLACALEAFRPARTLLGMVPSDKLEWRPGPKFMSLGQLIYHLSDGLGLPFRCLVTGAWPFKNPEEMIAQMQLEKLPACDVAEALERLEKDEAALRETLDTISEEDFARKTVAAPWGAQGTLDIMAIYFREHFTNHKMQLFTYLKLLDLPVNTETLYNG